MQQQILEPDFEKASFACCDSPFLAAEAPSLRALSRKALVKPRGLHPRTGNGENERKCEHEKKEQIKKRRSPTGDGKLHASFA